MANNGKVTLSALASMQIAFLMTVLMLVMFVSAEEQAADFQAGMEAYNRGDYATALREFRPLAGQGYAWAQYSLGVMYADGDGVPQDYVEAAKWYRKAAEQGHAAAQGNLGAMYADGLGVPQDDAEAVKWFRKAAKQGRANAQALLGVMYGFGYGVPQDAVEAYAWLNIAVGQGFQPAKETREAMAESMTRKEISRAQELAREYWEKYVLPFRN